MRVIVVGWVEKPDVTRRRRHRSAWTVCATVMPSPRNIRDSTTPPAIQHLSSMASSSATNNSKAAWFDENPTEDQLPQATRELLETYSGVPPNEVLQHVVCLRDEAWKVHPYPCIGQFRFLEPSFTHLSNEFEEIVSRLDNGQNLLDMACCFGQTIRQLVAGGAPAKNILGCDLQPDFIELGFKLFRDHDKLEAKFLIADIFDRTSPLADLKGNIDMVFAGSFFHLWGYAQQVEASKAVAALLRPQPGSMILGRQVGAVEALEQSSATGVMFRHNVQSFRTMWRDIGDDVGVDFEVEANLTPLTRRHMDWHETGTRRLWFVVRRK